LTDDECPEVDVVVAAYNEEKVIGRLLQSLGESNYPAGKLRIWVGSDLSTDGTDRTVLDWISKNQHLSLVRMEARTGKSGIINHLVGLGKAKVVVGTDANIVFTPDAVRRLVSTLVQRQAGVVGGRLVYQAAGDRLAETPGSIASEERHYTQFESKLKQWESDLFGCTLGVEGGCYAVARSVWQPIPPATFMEDFFVSLQVLRTGRPVLWEGRAVAYEDVSVDRHEEFARKVRISLGNYQNLARFWPLLFTKPLPLGLLFLGHKVLRWLFPLVALGVLALAGWKLFHGTAEVLEFATLSAWALAVASWISLSLWPKNQHNPLQPLGYFTALNAALLLGLARYLRGVKSSVWKPTERTI
jgi:cellulose synthase/poly-beta-1,6-N-acetylglucosamine synthase-like glycosyltransferase